MLKISYIRIFICNFHFNPLKSKQLRLCNSENLHKIFINYRWVKYITLPQGVKGKAKTTYRSLMLKKTEKL